MESLLFQISSRFDTKYETDLMYTLNIHGFQLDKSGIGGEKGHLSEFFR